MRFLVLLCGVLLVCSSCKIEAEEILYGKDACHFCSMTIVDRQHAAQIVTQKGRAYKFDAVECMINDLKRREGQELSIILVNDYNEPGKQISAMDATYLICNEIPSPMGANLSAFLNAEIANKMKEAKGGEIYTWTTIQQQVH